MSSLKVINDRAKHTIKLGSDFTEAITNNKAQRPAILQQVELTHQKYPKPTNLCFEEKKC